MWLITLLLIAWLICAGLTAAVASSRGRDVAPWFAAGFCLGPIALFAVGFMPAVADPDATRRCPQCAEAILHLARRCKHCGAAVEPVQPPAPRRGALDEIRLAVRRALF